MKKFYSMTILLCVCLFSFLGGMAGELIQENMLYAQNEENEIKYEYFDYIEAKTIETKNIIIDNLNDDTVANIKTVNNQPIIRLYTKDKPEYSYKMSDNEFQKIKNEKGILEAFAKRNKTKINNPASLLITTYDEIPSIMFYDKDGDQRIVIGVNNNYVEPFMNFYYRSEKRLSLGTNNLTNESTGKKEEIEGSIFFFFF